MRKKTKQLFNVSIRGLPTGMVLALDKADAKRQAVRQHGSRAVVRPVLS